MDETTQAYYDELNERYVAECPYCHEMTALNHNAHNYLFIYGDAKVECEHCYGKFNVVC